MADTASQYQPLLDQQAQERGTRYAEPMYPAGYSEAQRGAEELGTRLYKGGALPSAEATKEQMIQSLYEYDKKLDQANYSPFPKQTLISTGQPYIPNPADYSRAGAGYISALGGQTNAFQRAIQNVETSYQDAINNLINRYIDFATLAEKRKQREEDKRAGEQNTLIEILKVTGGDYTDPNTNQTFHFPSPQERAELEKRSAVGTAEERATEQTRQAFIADVKRGMTVSDLWTIYGGTLQEWEMIQLYNQNSPYGPMKESPGELPSTGDMNILNTILGGGATQPSPAPTPTPVPTPGPRPPIQSFDR